MEESWGYAGPAEAFLALPVAEWVTALAAHHQRLFGMPTAQSQLNAWREQHHVMVAAFTSCKDFFKSSGSSDGALVSSPLGLSRR